MPVHVPIKKFTNWIQGDRANTLAKVWNVTAQETMHRGAHEIPQLVTNGIVYGNDKNSIGYPISNAMISTPAWKPKTNLAHRTD